MSDKKSLVEEAVIQMKNLEDVIAENAKGILASTMKQEINELVKESLKEQDEVDVDSETIDVGADETMDADTEVSVDVDANDEDINLDDTEMDSEIPMDDEESVVKDLTKAPMSDVIKAFMEMGEDDGIIIKKNDDNTISLSDENTDKSYLIKLGESIKNKSKKKLNEMEFDEEFYSEEDDLMSNNEMGEEFSSEEMNEILDELDNFENVDESEDVELDYPLDEEETMYEVSLDEDEDVNEDEDEIVYEIEMSDETSDYDFTESEMDEEVDEDYNEEEMTNESIGFKPKGKGFGKPKFNYKKTTGGFKEDKKQGPRGVGMGKGPKFEFKEESETKPKVKKSETKEAARTLGNGRKWGRKGLDKPRTAPRHLATESVNNEINMLKSKNEEYRKALNLFRDKLNEVAVFNSNLAYATRLFTEHSTTKQEKINILRRFDGAETIKESKTLYKTIKDELSSKNDSQIVKESVETKINKTPSTGSAINLIESKTYENPQFMRMKDIMQKLIK